MVQSIEGIPPEQNLRGVYNMEEKKKTWKIPIIYSVAGFVTVEADTLEDALDKAENDDSIGTVDVTDASFVDGTWELDCYDEDYIRKYYNHNQQDAEGKE